MKMKLRLLLCLWHLSTSVDILFSVSGEGCLINQSNKMKVYYIKKKLMRRAQTGDRIVDSHLLGRSLEGTTRDVLFYRRRRRMPNSAVATHKPKDFGSN